MRPNITELIVEHDLCIGCGVCSGVCPVDVLPMEFNSSGEYTPHKIQGCLDKCTFCIDVCPFVDTNDNEDILGEFFYADNVKSKHSIETGYYLNTYMSYDINRKARLQGASGGATTWLLKTLYESGLVDHVVCVENNKDTEKLFDYEVYNNLTFLNKSPGSVYYPVELSGAINYILATPGKYVITGLPCFIKSIRLAQKKSKKLRERIKFTIALTCGQMKSNFYTKHLATLSGTLESPTKVHYRGKNQQKEATNFYFSSIDSSNKLNKLYWNDGVSSVWTNRWYTPTACDYCDDIFGETADISVMDAWLPEYISDPKGTSLLITRSSEIDKIISEAILGKKLGGKNIDIKKVIQSQLGVLDIKREKLSYRLHLAAKEGLKVPNKRVKPSSKLNYFVKKEIELKREMQKESKCLLKESGGIDMEKLNGVMTPLLKRTQLMQNIYQKIILPQRIIRKIIKIINKD